MTLAPARSLAPFVLCGCLLSAAAPAAGQVPAAPAPGRAAQGTATPADPGPDERLFSLQVTGGAVATMGEAANAAGLGWNVGVGGEVRVRDWLGLRAQYLYARFAGVAATAARAAGTVEPSAPASVEAKLQSHTGFFDAVLRKPLAGTGRTVYLVAGPLASLRRVRITSANGGASPYHGCQPQWLQCSPEPIPFDRALGIRRATSLGASAGAGAAVDVGLTAQLVIEARYVFLSGPTFTDVNGRTQSASASYFPITVGLRF